mgnify:CR=1 FL=1|jgi:flavin reductase (DIM6/NTAB) family NADH-FMN oxidoreductase RutF
MNENAKKALLRAIPHGLYVVTTGAGNDAHGFTSTWLTQASFKPPLVMMAVRRDSHAFAAITKNRAFVVNFIPKDARAMAERFFQPPRAENQSFGEFAFAPSPATGSPVLAAALGYLDCRVVPAAGDDSASGASAGGASAGGASHGDHAVILGEVVEAAELRPGAPLILADTPWKYGG